MTFSGVMAILWVAQLLGFSFLFGRALADSRAYRVPFGRQFMTFRVQVAVCLWLFVSLMANVLNWRLLCRWEPEYAGRFENFGSGRRLRFWHCGRYLHRRFWPLGYLWSG